MKIEALVSTVDSSPELYEIMNLQSDALIINQCSQLSYEEFEKAGKRVRFYSFPERGVGKSRNTALCRSEGDICLLCDDDMRYKDGYERIILDAFEKYPSADVILFSLDSQSDSRVQKNGRLRRFQTTKFGAPNVAFRRTAVFKANASFSLLFGGGSIWGGSGEDTIFIQELFDKGLKVYGCTDSIASFDSSESSSWFDGYNDDFFEKKGRLYGAFAGKKSYIITAVTALRWCLRLKRKDFFHILSLYYKGIQWFFNQR